MNRRGLLGLLALGGGLSLAASAPLAERLPRRLDGTFLQVWKDDLALPRSGWERRIAQIRDLGCRTLVLQWIAYGETYALSARLLDDVLDLASASGLTVRLGLPYEEGYWRMLADPAPAVRHAFFDRATQAGVDAMRSGEHAGHPAFSGWYVPYEIEQHSWAGDERRAILIRYLSALADAAGDSGPLAVSTFRSALPGTETLDALWRPVLDTVPLRLMVQDGVGVLGMGNYAHLAPLFSLLRARGTPFDTVVELFTEQPSERTDGTTFRAIPATMVRLHAQLQAAADSGAQTLIGFAVHPYMTDGTPGAETLRRAYARALAQGGTG